MQTKRKQCLIGVIVCSLVIATTAGFAAAQAPPGAATPKPVRPAPPANPNAVLTVIPADSAGFVAVRNIAEIDYDFKEVLDKLQLPLGQMGFPGLLDMVKERAGITEGLEANSGAAIALLNCSKLKSVDQLEKRAVIILPTDNAEGLVKSLGGRKQGDTYQLIINNQPAIATEKSGFLIIAPSDAPDDLKEVVQSKQGIEKTLPADRLKAYATADMFAWANIQGFPEELRTAPLNTLKGMMMLSGPPGGVQEIEKSVSGMNKFLNELKEVSIGLTLDPKIGLKLGFWYQAMPGSDVAKRLAAVKLTEASLLTGLPDEPVILAGGAVNTLPPAEIQRMFDESFKPETLGQEVDEAQAKALKGSLIGLATSVEGVSASIAGLPSESEYGMIGFTAVMKTPNSQRAQADVRKLIGIFKDMIIKAAVANQNLTEEQAKSLNEAIQLKENAEKLTGAVVDHLVVDLSKLPMAEENPAQLDQIKSVVGQEGILVRIAQIGEKHLAITFGGGAKRFAQVVDLVQKNQSPLADRKTLKMVTERLPSQKKIAEGYLSVDRLLAFVMELSMKLGQPMPLPLMMKETAPLAVVAAQTGESAVTVDVLVPIELAQSAAEMARPMMMMFLGGGMPGAGGTMPEEEQEENTPTPITPPVR